MVLCWLVPGDIMATGTRSERIDTIANPLINQSPQLIHLLQF